MRVGVLVVLPVLLAVEVVLVVRLLVQEVVLVEEVVDKTAVPQFGSSVALFGLGTRCTWRALQQSCRKLAPILAQPQLSNRFR